MATQIATRAYCNTVASGAYSSETTRCVTYESVNSNTKVKPTASHSAKQLLTRDEIAKRTTTSLASTCTVRLYHNGVNNANITVNWGGTTKSISRSSYQDFTWHRNDNLQIQISSTYTMWTTYDIGSSQGGNNICNDRSVLDETYFTNYLDSVGITTSSVISFYITPTE